MKNMTISTAKKIAGSLGFPSKMPGTAYALPAAACVAGSRLARIKGSICSGCYALNGGANYQMPRAMIGQNRRLAAIRNPLWADAMVRLLSECHSRDSIKVDLGLVGIRRQRKGGSRYQYNQPGFHRWHDSGDIQSVDHLGAICDVAWRTPKIRHWLPTQELGMVNAYIKSGGTVPENLIIRVSSVMLDDNRSRAWPHTSSVFQDKKPSDTHICPAPEQDHRCGDCRACWSREVRHVAYAAH